MQGAAVVFQESQGLKIAVDTEEKQVEAERFTKVKLQVEALVAKTFSSTRCKASCFEMGKKGSRQTNLDLEWLTTLLLAHGDFNFGLPLKKILLLIKMIIITTVIGDWCW